MTRRMTMTGKRWLAAIAIAGAVSAAAPDTVGAFEPAVEALNYSKIHERETYVVAQPAFQLRMMEQVLSESVEYRLLVASDPERDFTGNLCASRTFECAGDVRLYDWGDGSPGLVEPVLFTARNGATLSGTVWRSMPGPARRPGIVITTGGLAPETLYWGFAATLARHGYVVLTYDVMQQGRSDTYGEEPDRDEGRTGGIQAFASGQPFYDGTEDALDFLLSTPESHYVPRPSCGNANGGVATGHSPKHLRRVAEGRNAAFNPFWHFVDPARIGVAGHSQGAGAASFIGQKDPRVRALVAWDRLRPPVDPPAECPSNPESRTDAEISKPALGLTADYGQPPEPNTSDPDPEARSGPFLVYRDAGIDAMQINIRGGTHYEFSFIPGYTTTYPFGTASLRGYDLVAWYTTAWFDRYVKCTDDACKEDAEARLLTDRWRNDPRGGAVDPTGDRNVFSLLPTVALRTDAGGRVARRLRRHAPRLRDDGTGRPPAELRPSRRRLREVVRGCDRRAVRSENERKETT